MKPTELILLAAVGVGVYLLVSHQQGMAAKSLTPPRDVQPEKRDLFDIVADLGRDLVSNVANSGSSGSSSSGSSGDGWFF